MNLSFFFFFGKGNEYKLVLSTARKSIYSQYRSGNNLFCRINYKYLSSEGLISSMSYPFLDVSKKKKIYSNFFSRNINNK